MYEYTALSVIYRQIFLIWNLYTKAFFKLCSVSIMLPFKAFGKNSKKFFGNIQFPSDTVKTMMSSGSLWHHIEKSTSWQKINSTHTKSIRRQYFRIIFLYLWWADLQKKWPKVENYLAPNQPSTSDTTWPREPYMKLLSKQQKHDFYTLIKWDAWSEELVQEEK